MTWFLRDCRSSSRMVTVRSTTCPRRSSRPSSRSRFSMLSSSRNAASSIGRMSAGTDSSPRELRGTIASMARPDLVALRIGPDQQQCQHAVRLDRGGEFPQRLGVRVDAGGFSGDSWSRSIGMSSNAGSVVIDSPPGGAQAAARGSDLGLGVRGARLGVVQFLLGFLAGDRKGLGRPMAVDGLTEITRLRIVPAEWLAFRGQRHPLGLAEGLRADCVRRRRTCRCGLFAYSPSYDPPRGGNRNSDDDRRPCRRRAWAASRSRARTRPSRGHPA